MSDGTDKESDKPKANGINEYVNPDKHHSSNREDKNNYNKNYSDSALESGNNIPQRIGKGQDARNSVVWYIITYSLTMYSCVVASLIVIDVLKTGGVHALETVKDSWAIFTPIITLSLGYMFGKRDDEVQKKSDGIKYEEEKKEEKG